MKNPSYTFAARIFGFVTLSLLMSLPIYATDIVGWAGEDFEMGNMLTWKTVNEQNNKEFLVERSADGQAFDVIGNIKSQGNASRTQEYRFLDVAAQKGKTYYRLKQINLDNSFKYSEIITVLKGTTNNFTIVSMTPLEGENSVEITLDVKTVTEVTYFVERLNEQIIYSGTQRLNLGYNVITVDVSELTLGTYKISLKGDDELETLTFRTTPKKKIKRFADFDDGE